MNIAQQGSLMFEEGGNHYIANRYLGFPCFSMWAADVATPGLRLLVHSGGPHQEVLH